MQRTTIILACFLICVVGHSQQYPFVHYTPKDGLANSRVKKAYQDSKGRMYFLTYGGLSVFDGARFRNYTTQNGLANSVVNDILEVGDDSILVATNSGNFLNVLVKGAIGRLKTEGARCPVINQFYQANDGKIYLSSDDGLFVLEKKKLRQLDISEIAKPSGAPYLGNISCTGSYLVITVNEMAARKGLYLYDIKNNRVCDALTADFLYLLGKDNNDHIWIFRSNKLFILDSVALSKGKLLLTEPLVPYLQTRNYSTTNVAFDKKCIWFVYRDQDYRNIEIRRIDESGSMLIIPLPQQATSSDIKNIFIDRENTVWLCNDGEGVFKIINSSFRVQNPLGQVTESPVNNVFHSGGTTWFSTSTAKFFRQSGKSLIEFRSNLHKSLEILDEHDGRLLAYDSRSIYEARLTDQRRIHFQKIISLPDSDGWGKKIILDHYGNILASQNKKVSVWKDHKEVSQIPLSKNDAVEDIWPDKNNLVWIVTRFNGISVFNVSPQDPSKYLQLVYHFATSEPSGSTRSFVIDKGDLVWIGTRELGLMVYKQEGDHFNKLYQFDVTNGLTDNFVTCLACDSLDNIIVGTQTGLDRISHHGNEYQIENLSKTNDVFAYIKKVWTDQQNEAYALTTNGTFLHVSPPSIKNENSSAPQLLLEEIRVNGRATSAFKNNFVHDENNISFFIAAPSFIDEKRVAFSYLLEGSGNKQWSDTSSANAVINLTNLSPGEYRLRVRAFFPSSAYTPANLSYSFEIIPPWWQTWWFRALSLVFLVGFVIAGLRFYYRRRLERQKAALEKRQAIEKERTRIATDMHDDLGAGLSRIKFLSQSILNKKIGNDTIETELEKITNFSDEMSEKMGEIVWALNEKNDTLADLVAYTRSYAVEYLANHQIDCEANTPLHLPGTFITGEMRRNIFLSVKECLHNIVKHSGATKVFFYVQLDNEMRIVIHDNGKGIDWNNRRAFSNGLENVHKRMKEISGEVNFANEQGTKVSLAIPLTL